MELKQDREPQRESCPLCLSKHRISGWKKLVFQTHIIVALKQEEIDRHVTELIKIFPKLRNIIIYFFTLMRFNKGSNILVWN